MAGARKGSPAVWHAGPYNMNLSNPIGSRLKMSCSYEVFHIPLHYEPELLDEDSEPYARGWYYWHQQPGCLPDSEPFGPFETAAEAAAAAKEECEEALAEAEATLKEHLHEAGRKL